MESAFPLVWEAAPIELVGAIALQIVARVGVAVQFVLGSHVLPTILAANREGSAFAAVVPALAVILAISAVVTFANAAQGKLQVVLVELAGRHANDRIIDVATAVDLEPSRTPSSTIGSGRPRPGRRVPATQRLSIDLVHQVSSIIGAAGLVAALTALAPYIAPLVLVAYIPLRLAMMRNSHVVFMLNMT
jgi:hypothetical protein